MFNKRCISLNLTALSLIFIVLLISVKCNNTDDNINNDNNNNNDDGDDVEESEQQELVAQTLQNLNEKLKNIKSQLEVHLNWRFLTTLINSLKIKSDELQANLLIIVACFYAKATISQTVLLMRILDHLNKNLLKEMHLLKPIKLKISKQISKTELKSKRLYLIQTKINSIITQLELVMRISAVEYFEVCISRALLQIAHVLRDTQKPMSKELRNFMKFFALRLMDERARSANSDKRAIESLSELVNQVENPELIRNLYKLLGTPTSLVDTRTMNSDDSYSYESVRAYEQIFAAYSMQVYSKLPQLRQYIDADKLANIDVYLTQLQLITLNSESKTTTNTSNNNNTNSNKLKSTDTFIVSLIDDQELIVAQAAEMILLLPVNKFSSFEEEVGDYFDEISTLKTSLVSALALRKIYNKVLLNGYKLFLLGVKTSANELLLKQPLSKKCAQHAKDLFQIYASIWNHKFNIDLRVEKFIFDLLHVNYDYKRNVPINLSLIDYENNFARLLLNMPANERRFMLKSSGFIHIFGKSLSNKIAIVLSLHYTNSKYEREYKTASLACKNFETTRATLKLANAQFISIVKAMNQYGKLVDNYVDDLLVKAKQQRSYFCAMNTQSYSYAASTLYGFTKTAFSVHFDYTQLQILADDKNQLFDI